MTTINDALRKRANSVIRRRWINQNDIADAAGISETRLMGIRNGFYGPPLEEWDRIFLALQVDPFGTEIFPTFTPERNVSPVAPQDGESQNPEQSTTALCGVKHRHLDVFCARVTGHPDHHVGGGWDWPQGQEMSQIELLHSVRDSVAAALSRVDALEKRVDRFEKHTHTVNGTGTVSGTTSTPTTK